jgi:predicted DsbA family dithiol-disulfide isomerase
MSDFIEGGTCNADGCTIDASSRESDAWAKKTNILSVEIVSDAICPWCYVAKRQFERAVAKLPNDVKLSVHWRPFELNRICRRKGWIASPIAAANLARGSIRKSSTRK